MGYIIEEELKKTRALTSKVGEATITFEYRENAFTPELEDIARGDKEDAVFDTPTVLLMLKELIATWDVSKNKADDEAKIYVPIEDAWLKKIPKRLLVRMLSDIGTDLNPPSASETNS